MVGLDHHHSPPRPNGSRPMVGGGHLRGGIRRADLGNGAAPQEQVLRMNPITRFRVECTRSGRHCLTTQRGQR